MSLNSAENNRLTELRKVPEAKRTPAQKKEVADLEAKQNSTANKVPPVV